MVNDWERYAYFLEVVNDPQQVVVHSIKLRGGCHDQETDYIMQFFFLPATRKG